MLIKIVAVVIVPRIAILKVIVIVMAIVAVVVIVMIVMVIERIRIRLIMTKMCTSRRVTCSSRVPLFLSGDIIVLETSLSVTDSYVAGW